MSDKYLFNSAEHESELLRLRKIEALYDPETRRWLEQANVVNGSDCLEVGAGAGSIVHWMSERVGLSGRVLAVDANPRFLSWIESSNVTVVKGNIRDVDLIPKSFDVIHARYVLERLPHLPSAI